MGCGTSKATPAGAAALAEPAPEIAISPAAIAAVTKLQEEDAANTDKGPRAHFSSASKLERVQVVPGLDPKEKKKGGDDTDEVDPDQLRRALSVRSLTRNTTFKTRDEEKDHEDEDKPFSNLGIQRNQSFFTRERAKAPPVDDDDDTAPAAARAVKASGNSFVSSRSLKSHVSFAANVRPPGMEDGSQHSSGDKYPQSTAGDDPDLDDPDAFKQNGDKVAQDAPPGAVAEAVEKAHET